MGAFILTLFLCTDPNVHTCPVEKEPAKTIHYAKVTYDECMTLGKWVTATAGYSEYKCTPKEPK